MARDAIAATLDVAPGSFAVTVIPELPAKVQAILDDALASREAAERASELASMKAREAARILHEEGMPLHFLRSYRGGRLSIVPRGKPSPKLAITVDPDVHAKVIEAAAEDGVSVSAWMTAAARRELLVRDGLAAVAEWEAEQGALTETELAAARARVARELSATPPRSRRRPA
jgi:hypothetical protein